MGNAVKELGYRIPAGVQLGLSIMPKLHIPGPGPSVRGQR